MKVQCKTEVEEEEEKKNEMPFCRIDTFDGRSSLFFFCLLSGENATLFILYNIHEPLPIIHIQLSCLYYHCMVLYSR